MNISSGYGLSFRHILGGVLVFSLFGYCAQAGSDDAGYHPDLCCHSGPYALRLPKSLKALRSIGKLKNEFTDIEDHGRYKLEIKELVFDGLSIVVVTQPDDDDYLIEGVTITGQDWKILPSFRIGETEEIVNKRLDGRARKVGDWLEIGGDADQLRFRISNGIVVEIIYYCYTG